VRLRLITLLGVLGTFLNQAGSAAVPPRTAALPLADPASEGFSGTQLQTLHRFMQGVTDAGDYPGAVTLIARHGRIVDWRAYGSRDIAKSAAMEPNSIFRIYSMTKTVTSVALLALMEEGKLALDDPVARYLPEFADMRVFTGGTPDAPQTRTATRSITIRHLMTHRAGFAVGGEDAKDAVSILNRANLQQSADLKTYCARLSRVPLAVDPGTRFNYDGVQMVVLSRLIEVVAASAFDEFLQQRIFTPLRLVDTGFSVPVAQRDRIVEMSSADRDGHLVPAPEYSGIPPGEQLNPYPSGAGGLYSTAADFARFSQMLLNGGELDGMSILSPRTVALMMTDQLSQEYTEGRGFGLGGYVVRDVARNGGWGSVGQFGWSGAASTYYTIDPKQQLVAILLLQHLPQDLPGDPPKISTTFYNLVYRSLVSH
jgi:CubicO group peptidase (beta-lactamase class C family)